jgi:hypothetical protein
MPVIHAPRLLVELPIVVLRALVVFLESIIPNYPASSFWIDYVSISRTCAADSTPRAFGLMPARFTYRLEYLVHKPWWKRMAGAGTARRAQAIKWLREHFPRLPS